MTYQHGYRLSPDLSFAAFASILDLFGERAKAAAAPRVASRLARSMVEMFDDDARITAQEARDGATRAFLEKHARNLHEKRRDARDDFHCEISILAGEAGRGYALLHASQDFYHGILSAIDGIEAWPWYAAEDLPEGVSEREWEERRQTWTELLARNRWRSALAFELYGPSIDLPSVAELRAAMPSDEERARRIARTSSLADFPAAKAATSFEEMSRAFWRHDDWLRTEAGRIDLDLHVAKAMAALRPFELED